MCCDFCPDKSAPSSWFHLKCVGLDARKNKVEGIWVCQKCIQDYQSLKESHTTLTDKVSFLQEELLAVKDMLLGFQREEGSYAAALKTNHVSVSGRSQPSDKTNPVSVSGSQPSDKTNPVSISGGSPASQPSAPKKATTHPGNRGGLVFVTPSKRGNKNSPNTKPPNTKPVPLTNKFSVLQVEKGGPRPGKTETMEVSPKPPAKAKEAGRQPSDKVSNHPGPATFPPGHPNYNNSVSDAGSSKLPNKRISLLVGDSNVRFVGEKLHNYIDGDFVVCSISGAGVREIKDEAIRIMKKEKLTNFDIQLFIHAGVNDVDPYWDNSSEVRSHFRALCFRIKEEARLLHSTVKIYIISIPPTKKYELINNIRNCDVEQRIININQFFHSSCESQLKAHFVDLQVYQQGKYLGKDHLHYHPRGALQVALEINHLSQNFLDLGTHHLLQTT